MRTAHKLVTVLGGVQTYIQRVLALSPYAYWPLNEAAGATTALDIVGGFNSTAISGVTFGAPGIGDGNTAARIGANSGDGITLDAANIASALSKDSGTILLWINWSSGGTSDNVKHPIATFVGDAANSIYLEKNTSNSLRFHRRASSVSVAVSTTSIPVVWFLYAMTYSVNANQLIGYINGVPLPTQTNIQSWTGTGLTAAQIAKNYTDTGFGGDMAHFALFSRVLTAAELLELATL